jgi:hypothetical protein
MPRSKPTPTLEEITRAAGEAGIADESERQEFARKLAIARLMLKGTNRRAAVKQVTANLPDSKRKAALQRRAKGRCAN